MSASQKNSSSDFSFAVIVVGTIQHNLWLFIEKFRSIPDILSTNNRLKGL